MTRCAAPHCCVVSEDIYIGAYDPHKNLCKRHAQEEWAQYRQDQLKKLYPDRVVTSSPVSEIPAAKKPGRKKKEKVIPTQAPVTKKAGPSIASVIDPLLFEGKMTLEEIAKQVAKTLQFDRNMIGNVASRLHYLEKVKKFKVSKTTSGIIKVTK